MWLWKFFFCIVISLAPCTQLYAAVLSPQPRTICLDGTQIETPKSFHSAMQNAAHFPPYYGKNLDALWDMVTEDQNGFDITWYNADNSATKLNRYNNYFNRIQNLFDDARKEGIPIELKLVPSSLSPQNPCFLGVR